MSDSLARNTVAALWGALFIVALIIPLRLYATNWLGEAWFDQILSQINRSYVPYLGALISFYFATGVLAKPKQIPVSATVVAVLCALVWNGLNLYFLISLWVATTQSSPSIQVDAVVSGMDKYSSMLSWIVAPGMGYFFGSHFKAKA